MCEKSEEKQREFFELMLNLAREIRCCSRDEAFCGNVTFQQFVILDAVAQAGALDLAALHGILAVEKSTTTRLVDPLLRKGLLNREKAAHDSRAATLSLTEAGRRAHAEVWDCLTGFFAGVARNIGEEEREAVCRAVRLFAGALGKAAADCRCGLPAVAGRDA
jgi:DNA-binding MarR family transcriptional regulator